MLPAGPVVLRRVADPGRRPATQGTAHQGALCAARARRAALRRRAPGRARHARIPEGRRPQLALRVRGDGRLLAVRGAVHPAQGTDADPHRSQLHDADAPGRGRRSRPGRARGRWRGVFGGSRRSSASGSSSAWRCCCRRACSSSWASASPWPSTAPTCRRWDSSWPWAPCRGWPGRGPRRFGRGTTGARCHGRGVRRAACGPDHCPQRDLGRSRGPGPGVRGALAGALGAAVVPRRDASPERPVPRGRRRVPRRAGSRTAGTPSRARSS